MYILDANTVTIELLDGPDLVMDRAQHDQIKKEMVESGLVAIGDANAVEAIHRRARSAGYDLRTNLQGSPSAALVPNSARHSKRSIETKLFPSIAQALLWLTGEGKRDRK